MNLGDVLDELSVALDEIPDLRVPKEGGAIHPPAAIVSFPESINRRAHAGNSTVLEDMIIMVLIREPGSRTAMTEVRKYVAESGPWSVTAKLESYAFTSCDLVTVHSIDFETVEFADTPYLAAMFHTTIHGRRA